VVHEKVAFFVIFVDFGVILGQKEADGAFGENA